MTDLEDGFYWVRRGSSWFVAEYEYGSFWLSSVQREYAEHWFDEIDPRRIVREGGEAK